MIERHVVFNSFQIASWLKLTFLFLDEDLYVFLFTQHAYGLFVYFSPAMLSPVCNKYDAYEIRRCDM